MSDEIDDLPPEPMFSRFVTWLRSFWTKPAPVAKEEIPEGYTGELDKYLDFTPVETIDDLFLPGDRIYRRRPIHPGPTPNTHILAGMSRLRTRVSRFPPHELRLVKIEQALVLPRQIIINLRTGLPILDSLRKIPPRGEPVFPVKDWQPAHEIEAILANMKTKRLKGTTFYGSSRHTAYGHSILEGMSRFWATSDLGRHITRYLIPTTKTDFPAQLYTAFGLNEDNMLRLTKKAVVCDNLVMASQAFYLGRQMSAEYWDIADRVRTFFAKPDDGRPRVYISRRLAHKRRIVNEELIEEEFKKFGFRVVHPEEMTTREQVESFATASWIAGPVGSGMYNTIFAPPDVRKIIVGPGNFHTPIDGVVSREHGPLYIFGRKATDDRRGKVLEDWEIDPKRVRYGLERIFAPRWRHKLHNLFTSTTSEKLGG